LSEASGASANALKFKPPKAAIIMHATDPVITFLLVLVIGVGAGVLFDRLAGPSWLARQFSGSTRGVVTSALVGVLLLALGGEIVAAIVAAALGAAVVLLAWRMAK
jgi:hypothetical protein